jgi:hypothetical protein
MKTIRSMAAQGDVLFRRVAAIPNSARERPRAGPLVVAHSETGHDHVIHASAVTLFETADPLVCFLRLDSPFADVEHLRPYDTHETLRLLGDPGGSAFYELRRQREHVPDASGQVSRMIDD